MNRKHHDNPLTDMLNYGEHPFPPDTEALIRRVLELGKRPDTWPIDENWPFSGREFDWERGDDLDGARRDLAEMVMRLEQGGE